MALDLAAVVQRAMIAAEAAVDGARQPVTYVRRGGTTYDPASGAASGSTTLELRAVVVGLRAAERAATVSGLRPQEGADVQERGVRFLFAIGDLPAGFVPTLKDQVRLGGETWSVTGWGRDPTQGALLTVQARRA